jgi:hypothetical protein
LLGLHMVLFVLSFFFALWQCGPAAQFRMKFGDVLHCFVWSFSCAAFEVSPCVGVQMGIAARQLASCTLTPNPLIVLGRAVAFGLL